MRRRFGASHAEVCNRIPHTHDGHIWSPIQREQAAYGQKHWTTTAPRRFVFWVKTSVQYASVRTRLHDGKQTPAGRRAGPFSHNNATKSRRAACVLQKGTWHIRKFISVDSSPFRMTLRRTGPTCRKFHRVWRAEQPCWRLWFPLLFFAFILSLQCYVICSGFLGVRMVHLSYSVILHWAAPFFNFPALFDLSHIFSKDTRNESLRTETLQETSTAALHYFSSGNINVYPLTFSTADTPMARAILLQKPKH